MAVRKSSLVIRMQLLCRAASSSEHIPRVDRPFVVVVVIELMRVEFIVIWPVLITLIAFILVLERFDIKFAFHDALEEVLRPFGVVIV